MARKHLSEQAQWGNAPAMLGALACPGRSLDELRPTCRKAAEYGGPGMSW